MSSLVSESAAAVRQLWSRCGDALDALDPLDLRTGVTDLLHPASLAPELPSATSELLKIFLGTSDLAVSDTDDRFADSAWRTHPLYRRIGQSYGLVERTMTRVAERAGDGDWRRQERARFLAEITTGALAPVNTLLGNPTAIKRAVDTNGRSLARGLRNMVTDVRANGAMPRMVDRRPFTVGRDLACTAGAVVHREEMFEVLQYRPTTATVGDRPLLMVPPQLNRHYILDLAPGRSLVEFSVSQGIQTFMVVWRNPRDGQGDWGLDDYARATLRAIEVVASISGSGDVNLLGLCGAGLTNALLLGYLATTGKDLVHSATQIVTMLDSREPNVVGALSTPRLLEALGKRAAKGAVVARGAVHDFAWLRPHDLVYGCLVNGWLLGEEPPTFDVLAWNGDKTRVSSAFLRDAFDVVATEKATRMGEVTVLGIPIDLSEVEIDTFHIVGKRDHISRWRSCVRSSQLVGGQRQLVVADSGHIGCVVSPPDESRHRYWSGPLSADEDPEMWLGREDPRDGSWWPAWSDWLQARSGEFRPAPTALGSADYPADCPAPGTYVHEH